MSDVAYFDMDDYNAFAESLASNRLLPLEQLKGQNKSVKLIFDDIGDISSRLRTLAGRLLYPPQRQARSPNPFITYPLNENRTKRSTDNDRVFPIETILLENFHIKHDCDVDEATLHVGPYADELARSYGALAMAIGDAIYFRDKAYDPSSEEGRKTLAHELTHVNQNKEVNSNRNKSTEDFEAEAKRTEEKEILDEDDIVTVKLRGREYRGTKKMMEYCKQKRNEGIDEWMDYPPAGIQN